MGIEELLGKIGLGGASPWGIGLNLLGGVLNWISGDKAAKEQNKLLEQMAGLRAQELADRRARWAQDDAFLKGLDEKSLKNVLAIQKKTSDFIPIFDRERQEERKKRDAWQRTSQGEDLLTKGNDMKAFLLDMFKKKLEREPLDYSSIHKDLAGVDRNLKRNEEYSRNFAKKFGL
jgi:hypothetical protein